MMRHLASASHHEHKRGKGGLAVQGRIAWGAAVLAMLGLLASFAMALGLGGDGVLRGEQWLYNALLAAAAIAVLARAAIRPEQRAAWMLIGIGLALWAAGDAYYDYVLLPRGTIPYPSLSDALYFGFYVSLILGVRKLGGRAKGQPLLSTGLPSASSVWRRSGRCSCSTRFSPPTEGGTAAVATTFAYPLLDLVLLCSVVLALTSHRWDTAGALIPLALGFMLLVVTDSIYAVQVANGTYVGSVLDIAWPASALLIAAASWMRLRPASKELPSTALISGLTMAAIVAAIGVLVWDHFARLDDLTVILASITLFAGLGQLILLRRENSKALAANRLRAASAARFA